MIYLFLIRVNDLFDLDSNFCDFFFEKDRDFILGLFVRRFQLCRISLYFHTVARRNGQSP